MSWKIKGAVEVDTSMTAQRAISSVASSIPGWVTATVYVIGDVIEDSDVIYKCNTGHTAGGTFAGDSANWTAIGSAGGGITPPTTSAAGDYTVLLADEVILKTGLTESTKATETLTFGANPLNNETVTVEGVVYTYLATFVDSGTNVHIGATASDSLDNLISAITGTATGSAIEGTDFPTGVSVNTDITAAQGAGDTMDVTALTGGTVGNSIDVSTNVTSGSWGASQLSGGLDDGGDTVTLPSGAGTGQSFIVVDTTGLAGIIPQDVITVDTAGAETIDGSATFSINGARGGATFMFDGTNYIVTNVKN